MPEMEIDSLAGPDGGEESQRHAAFWNSQLEKMVKDTSFKQYLKRGHKIESRYRDERNRNEEDGRKRYNSLWSNIEILTPAIYGKAPLPLAERKFADKDPIARGAAQILERALRNEIEINGFHDALVQAVRDYLLSGRGTVWVRYEPEITAGVSLDGEDSIAIKDNQGHLDPNVDADETSEDKEPDTVKLQETGDQIVRESTPVDYIHWEDFLIFPVNARTWAEVVAVGKRVFLTFEQMRDRFGKKIAKEVPLEKDDRQHTRESGTRDDEVKGEVFEIWNKQDRTVYWVADGYDYLLDRKKDPLNLENFFPTPRPIIANQTNGTLLPVADYIEYQDQATQIDELSQRIAMLARACKVAGVYNASAKGVQRLLNESVENELIPVDDWSAFAEKGGVVGQISFLPLKEIIGVINELVMIKEKQIEEMDRLTGINDLMRGTNDARETMGGVRMKANYTGTRLTARQNEVARFARDVVKIMADIMAQHFSPKSLVEVSGAMFEEGLGVSQDEMSALQAASPPPAAPPAPAPGTAPQMGQPPAIPSGPNVVPFPGMSSPPGMPITAPPVAPGIPMPPPPDPMQIALQQALQRIDAAIGLIRNERLRGFRVDIEVDSTIYGDAAQEKGDRVEFISEVTKFLETSMMMTAQVPEMAPLLGKLLQFGVRGFRVGRDLESTIEEFCDGATKLAKQKQAQAQAQPNPEQIKADAQAKQAEAHSQAATVRAQADMAKAQTDIAAAQLEARSNEQQAQAEVMRQQAENEGEQQNSAADALIKQMDVRMRQMELQIEMMRIEAEQKQIASDEKQMKSEERIAKSDEKIAQTNAKAAAARPKPSAA